MSLYEQQERRPVEDPALAGMSVSLCIPTT
jgi:hypothetical protein